MPPARSRDGAKEISVSRHLDGEGPRRAHSAPKRHTSGTPSHKHSTFLARGSQRVAQTRGWAPWVACFCLGGARCPPARQLGLGHVQGTGGVEGAQSPHSAGQPRLTAGTDPDSHKTWQVGQQSWGPLRSHNRVVWPSACCHIDTCFPHSVSSSGWAARPFSQGLTAPGNRGVHLLLPGALPAR